MSASESTRRAAQVVFTRVEPEFSPTAREGYQIVWASPWLVPAVVSEIESRVCCYSPLPERGPRLQFSALRSGGYFAARSEEVEVSRRVCDRAGRRVFLAQAGWVSDEALERPDFNPFAVLDAFAGVQRVEDLVDRFGQATGVATDLDIDGGDGLSGRLGKDAAEGSAALALTGEILSMSQPVSTARFFLRGESGKVESVLRMLWAFLPPVLRKRCSFDTEIYNCFNSRASYLLLAGHRPPPGMELTLVDLAAPAIPSVTDEACKVYLAWLSRALSAGGESVMATTETAYQIAQTLCRRELASKLEVLDRDTCREILQHEAERLRRRLAEKRRRSFRRQSSGEAFEAALREQVQTMPETVIAELAQHNGTGLWGMRSLFRNLWHLLRSNR